MDRPRSAPYRPAQVAVVGLVGLVCLELLVSATHTWHEAQDLEELHENLQRMDEFEETHLAVQRQLVEGISAEWLAEGEHWFELRTNIESLIDLGSHFDPATPGKLLHLRRGFDEIDLDPKVELHSALVLLGEIATAEHEQHEEMLDRAKAANRRQLQLEMGGPIVFLLLVGIGLWVVRGRVLRPLSALEELLGRLTRGEFKPVPLEHVDRLMRPLFHSFNELALRLGELEEAHRKHSESLEQKVRAATRTLLSQQRRLARAERLAATGELAAVMAHELRNPLAGIQMTLANLRRDLGDDQLSERVDLVIAEMGRLTRLLNEMLDSSRHTLEPPRTVDIGIVVDEILALVRYQLPGEIRLESLAPANLEARLPEDRLRQAVLNLVLNASNALSEAEGGTVTVDAQPEGDEIRIVVSDDGPGFPQELIGRTVRPFFSTREHGTGLGLAMVQRFASDVGGRMQLENRDPRGARVTLFLPVGGQHA